jgi:acyl carrier protein
MDNHVKGRVLEVLNRVTGKNIIDINLEGDLRSQLSLDSIMIVELFAALEKELGIELPLQLMTVKTGKAFMDMLEIELKSNVQ